MLCSGPGYPGTDPIKILQRKFYATHFLGILIGDSNLSTNQGDLKLA